MRKTFGLIIILIVILLIGLNLSDSNKNSNSAESSEKNYWFLLHRQSNKELLYFGEAGDASNSALIKVFKVKTGMPGRRPTPLPQLLGKEYWTITGKFEDLENPETAPYFLTLNIPVSEESPYGPVPYLECEGQCNWELPGAFGLHGNNGDPDKLAATNPGSSGCIRHSVEDITYIYNLIDPNNSQVRYYVYDI